MEESGEEEEDQRALCAAPLRTPSPSPKLQPAGSDPSPEQTTGADAHPEFEGEDMVGTSSPAGDSNVYATPAATPPPVPEGEDGARTPPSALSPVDDPQLPVSPKRKVETRDLDMDSSVELPALQKKAHAVAIWIDVATIITCLALYDPFGVDVPLNCDTTTTTHAGSGRSSAGEDDYQWDNIPAPRMKKNLCLEYVHGRRFAKFSSRESIVIYIKLTEFTIGCII